MPASPAMRAAPSTSTKAAASMRQHSAHWCAPRWRRTDMAERSKAGKVKLLAGGNPQIPKGYGDEPVQAYIAAMPGWKRDVGRALDALIERAVPKVRKAVK